MLQLSKNTTPYIIISFYKVGSFIKLVLMNFDMSNQNTNINTNNGLLRFRSAPSSILQGYVNDTEKNRDVTINNDHGLNYNFISPSFEDLEEEVDLKPNLMTEFSLSSQFPRQSTSQGSMNSTSTYSSGGGQLSSSIGVNMGVVDNLGQQQPKMGSSLLRQNSSPAGLFAHLNHPNGYSGLRGTPVGNSRMGNVGNNGDVTPSSGRLKRQTSGVPMLPRISEVEPDAIDPGVLNDSSDYPFGSWDRETSQFIDNFNGFKRDLHLQNGDNMGNHPPMLAHHLSLPKTSGEMAAVEKLLHFQDSVPCKIRAKRGCATHPRSIAERVGTKGESLGLDKTDLANSSLWKQGSSFPINQSLIWYKVRRTRISERMRKLQELVPHMDKQTNTSDMLDLAVDYIKDLQEQYKVLKECRANCRCSASSGHS